jgi:hypothetical protein
MRSVRTLQTLESIFGRCQHAGSKRIVLARAGGVAALALLGDRHQDVLLANPNRNVVIRKRCTGWLFKFCLHVNCGSWMVRTVKTKVFLILILDMDFTP